jgi:putative DNA primase/helicase
LSRWWAKSLPENPDGERALRHAARQALTSINYGQNVLTELKAQVRGDPEAEADADAFGVTTGEIAVANGLLDLDAAADGAGADALRPLRPDDYALARLPVEYDPETESSWWEAFVEEVAEDSEAADALQEDVGYCLHVGAMPIHRALLLVGSGANGKSTFLAVVQALLGEENTSSLELQTLANERDAVDDFYGSLANIDDDLSARKLGRGIGIFKKLTAGDRVRARHLYESGFEYQATGKHLYAANEVPDISDDVDEADEAFWRRWLLIEFPNYYPPNQRDPTLRDELTDDEALRGVLNWAIEGRARLLEQDRFTGEELLPQDKRHRWQAWGDSVNKFISECVKTDADAGRITTGEAHQRYVA